MACEIWSGAITAPPAPAPDRRGPAPLAPACSGPGPPSVGYADDLLSRLSGRCRQSRADRVCAGDRPLALAAFGQERNGAAVRRGGMGGLRQGTASGQCLFCLGRWVHHARSIRRRALGRAAARKPSHKGPFANHSHPAGTPPGLAPCVGVQSAKVDGSLLVSQSESQYW
jgi:hypothetical protein